MGTLFWDAECVVMIDFLSHKQTVNADQYQRSLKQLNKSLRDKQPGRKVTPQHHERPYTARSTMQCIERNDWKILPNLFLTQPGFNIIKLFGFA
ncbi:hypothetical protein ANN_04351 [Periplaneta americana]|uniref:Mariner Mos1 transposase n=1 Tax=Periplaneta americana TaxID=6978 RepID=A0ABQ8T9V9_PERAM|nr:hypothetical protein ANN_04351 [Periplaneta americana]